MKWFLRIAAVVLSLLLMVAGVWAYKNLSHPRLAPYASLQLKPSAAPASALKATFFGVTTLMFDDGETAVMTDGFFTRPGIKRLLLGKIAPDPTRIEAALKKGRVDKLATVLVAHSHHDHAMDSAAVARQTGALLVGSASTANIARGEGLPEDRIRVVQGGETLSFGRFKIDVLKANHSPGTLYPGEITKPLEVPAKVGAFKEGGSYTFVVRHDQGTIVVQSSANFVAGQLKNVRADVVFLSIGGLGKQSEQFARDYWREVVQATGAKVVIPIHWDDFTLPLDIPLQPMPALFDDFHRGMTMLTALAQEDHVAIRLMPAFEPFNVLDLRP